VHKIGTNTGHGYVWDRPDGMKAACGGPTQCQQCCHDQAIVMRTTDDSEAVTDSLSDHQIEILQMIAKGMNTMEVATTLYRSERTVKVHLSKAVNILGANNRTHAVAIAYELGLIGGGNTQPMPTNIALSRIASDLGFNIVRKYK
jgi:DNA-binding CsgD family transcriptional regulator